MNEEKKSRKIEKNLVRLCREHRVLDLRVEEMNHYGFLNESDQMVLKQLKKKKLQVRDEIEQLIKSSILMGGVSATQSLYGGSDDLKSTNLNSRSANSILDSSSIGSFNESVAAEAVGH